ncbi:MAG: hypothetical protein OEZ13_04210 [Spirochaetia bacterium]|nr:hypothetical protein [Spirochaetia bacterium]
MKNVLENMRMNALPEKFAPLFFIQRNNEIFALHPVEYENKNTQIIKKWPDELEWRSIFKFFIFEKKSDFAAYVLRLKDDTNLNLSSEEIETLLKAFNLKLNDRIIQEFYFIAKANNLLKRLYDENNIALKYLVPLSVYDETLLSEFIELLHKTGINNNTLREFLLLWADLNEENKNISISHIKKIFEETHKDGVHLLSEKIKNILFRLRYPMFTETVEKLKDLIKQANLPEYLTLDHHPYIEKRDIILSVKLKSSKDFDRMKIYFNDSDKEEKLKNIIEYLKGL